MSKKVLIVGCGQLGSRHLQAVAQIADVSDIFVFDHEPNALKTAQARLAEGQPVSKNTRIHWSTALRADFSGGDLCINAMQAKDRCSAVKKVCEDLGYKNFLIEKVVAPSLEEYEDLMNFSEAHRLSVWVNCKSRAYGIHKYIRSRLNPGETITFAAVAGNHGLANNGIHEADLFVYHDNCQDITLTGQHIEQKLHSSKRGKAIYDLAGTLIAVSEKGSECVISFKPDHSAPDTVFLVSPSARFMVDHYRKYALESYAKDDWAWRQVPIDENWMVSSMTRRFAEDILKTDVCELPTL